MAQQTIARPVIRGTPYPMSWEEFLEWAPGEGKTEWVDGWGVLYVSTSALHNRLVVFLGNLLGLYVRVFDLGEVFQENMAMRLEPRPVGRMPDVFVIGRDDGEQVLPKFFDGPALFVVEVISEESVERDPGEKYREYEEAGIPEYLTVDSRPGTREVRLHRIGADGHYALVAPNAAGRYHSEALPGLWIDPTWFQRQPLPRADHLMLEIAPDVYLSELIEADRQRRARQS